MWNIKDDQIVKIQNRMSDIREVSFDEPIEFIARTYELLGTLDTIIFDARNITKEEGTIIVGDK